MRFAVSIMNARGKRHTTRAVKQRTSNTFSGQSAQDQRSMNHVCILINARITFVEMMQVSWIWSHYAML